MQTGTLKKDVHVIGSEKIVQSCLEVLFLSLIYPFRTAMQWATTCKSGKILGAWKR